MAAVFHQATEQVNEGLVVLFIGEDAPALHPAIDQVMETTGIIQAGLTRHTGKLPLPTTAVNIVI